MTYCPSACETSTAKPRDFVLASVNATRQAFEDVALDDPSLDPVACLLRFDARLSTRPYDLQPVVPVVRFDPAKASTTPPTAPRGPGPRLDLLAMSARNFELLVRRLFEALEMRAWETQQSRDGGIDVLAVVEDEIAGIECVVEAKRYRNRVPPKEVRSLHSAMIDRNAHKGFVVTTGWFGRDSYDYADRNRVVLIDGKKLRHLLWDRCGVDAIIPLPKPPPGWSQADIT